MGRPKKWDAEYARSYMLRRAEELGRPTERMDLPPSARQQIPKALGVRTFGEAQKACGMKATSRLPRTPPPAPRRPLSFLDVERDGFTRREQKRKTEALAISVLTNCGKLRKDGTVPPGLWSADEEELRRGIYRHYPGLRDSRRAEILVAAQRLQKQHRRDVRRIPVAEYLGAA